MKPALLILLLGLGGSILIHSCVYLLGTSKSRAWMQSDQPELAWLKDEFNLDQAEFERVSRLHAGYLPRCRERCRHINELNAQLTGLLAGATNVTPELETLMNERAQMRAACQIEMLKHFFAVSKTMPAGQGKRYLAWAREITGLDEPAMHHGSMHSTNSAGR